MLEAAVRSHKGTMPYHNNEDRVGAFSDLGLSVVADGMGGHNSGDAASSIAIETIERSMRAAVTARWNPSRPWANHPLADAVRKADRAVSEWSWNPRTTYGQGSASTVVAACAVEDGILVAHVGDSRCYRLRGGQLAALTEDHSLVNEGRKMNLTPDQLATLPSNIVTRALGAKRPEGESVVVDVRFEPFVPGDIYLLCSDGLLETLSEDEIAGLLGVAADLDLACTRLIDEAIARKVYDDTSAVLVRWG